MLKLQWFVPAQQLDLEWVGRTGGTTAATQKAGTSTVSGIVVLSGTGPQGPPGSVDQYDPGDLAALYNSI